MNRIRGNFHTHTMFCDGVDPAREMAEQALAIGFTHLGFSGHMDPDIRMDLIAYDREIRRLQEAYRGRLDILRGVELDGLYEPRVLASAEGADPTWENAEDAVITTGLPTAKAGDCPGGSRAEKPDPAAKREAVDEHALLAGMEYLIGSTHFIESPSGGVPGCVDDTPERLMAFCREEFGGDYYRLAKAYYETEAKIRERTHCTFVGHFDLVTRFNDAAHFLEEADPRYYMPALEVMEHLVSQGLPFEINCGAVNRGRKAELYPNRFLLQNLRQMGGAIFISSDAHQKELLDGGFGIAARRAAECGFTHTLFLEHGADGAVRLREVPLDDLA